MPSITFIQADGVQVTIDVAAGITVMEGARNHGVAGIEAQCGGQCSCSTCHCYVDAAWYPRLPPVGSMEKDLLDFAWQPRETSRLTCQLVADESMDGLVLHVPSQQL